MLRYLLCTFFKKNTKKHAASFISTENSVELTHLRVLYPFKMLCQWECASYCIKIILLKYLFDIRNVIKSVFLHEGQVGVASDTQDIKLHIGATEGSPVLACCASCLSSWRTKRISN